MMTPIQAENPDRQFDHRKHIKSFLDTSRKVALLLPDGTPMEGITGIAGAAAITMISNEEIGVDFITLDPERNFPMHTHPGDHLLVFMLGTAIVEIGGNDWLVEPGVSIFIPGELPHGVKSCPGATIPAQFIAFGHPHHPIDSKTRMALAEPTESTTHEETLAPTKTE